MKKKQFLVMAFMLLGNLSLLFGQYSNLPTFDNRRSFGEYSDNKQYSNKTDAARMNLKGDVRLIIEKGSIFIDAPVAYYQFDEAGRLTALMAEDERGIEKLYDLYYLNKQGQLVERIQVKDFLNESGEGELPESDMLKYKYIYGPNGKPTNVIRWWWTHQIKGYFYYDAQGRLIKEKGTNGQVVTYEYGNGNHPLVAVCQESSDTKGDIYKYDNEGKNISVERLYEGKTIYKYDEKGRVTDVNSSSETFHYEYDENDNLKDGTRYVYDNKGNWIKKISPAGKVVTRTYYYGQSQNNFPTWKSSKFIGSWRGTNKKADGSTEYLFMDLDFNKHAVCDNFANNMMGTFQYKIQLPGGMAMTFGSYYIYYVRQGGNNAVIKFKPYGPYAEGTEFEQDFAYQALLTYNPQTKAMKISNIVKVVPNAKAGECMIKDQTMDFVE